MELSSILIGIVGKPSAGKSTILNALCLTDAKMGNYPFTTIKPNRGVALIRVPCPCKDLETPCNPRTGKCINHVRHVPVEMLDVAGLVPGASDGKGMGNQFLDDLRQADALIHVVDASGTTDAEGNQVDSYSPVQDVEWLDEELIQWIARILYVNWDRASKRFEQDPSKVVEYLQERLSGLGATKQNVSKALRQADLQGGNPRAWNEDDQKRLASALRTTLFPMVIAANKMDMQQALDHIKEIQTKYPDIKCIPTSGLAELTLRKSEEEGIITYELGSNTFEFIGDGVNSKKAKVLEAIGEKLLKPHHSTGVTELLEYTVFTLLEMIAVYPVEDPTHLTDTDGRVLPDVYLVPKGTTAKQFAGKIHSDLQDSFIHAVLVTSNNQRISADHELGHLDIIKIVSAAK